MKQASIPEHVSVTGKVVEMFEKEGKPVTRLAMNSFYLDVPTDYVPEAHLEDTVQIDGKLTIETVQNDFTVREPHQDTTR
jgi:hypothetical protein